MEDTDKYLIHADVTAEGVVERNDVVGAIFGQTEGLLGDDLDLRGLQQSSKVGRIDVSINSQNGQSFGRITIASGLDKVETAILGASLETIERIGPCRSTVSVERIEDVRAAKRRTVVDRAKSLLGAFEESTMSSAEIIDAVRESTRTGDITTYEGLPAGPRVAEGDAIIVVEGRADVLTLLGYGVKNAVAVEGTNVPEAVAELTTQRTTTAFLDGDRGGDLILKELTQVGDIDYVAVAPTGKSVEDLSREEALSSLREKVAHDLVVDAGNPREAVAATDGSARPAPPMPDRESTADLAEDGPHTASATRIEPAPEAETDVASSPSPEAAANEAEEATSVPDSTAKPASSTDDEPGEEAENEGVDESTDDGFEDSEDTDEPTTLAGHVERVVGEGTGRARLLDGEFEELAEVEASETFETLADGSAVPATVVLDGELSQRVLDVAAQRGVGQVVARSRGEFVKQPTDVRIRLANQFSETASDVDSD